MLSPKSSMFPAWFTEESNYYRVISGERLKRKRAACCIFGHEHIGPLGEVLRGFPVLCLPKNRRTLKTSLEKTLRSYIEKCGVRYFLLSWGGLFNKVAADLLAELRKDYPQIEVEIWVPSSRPRPDTMRAPLPRIPGGFPHHFLPASQDAYQLFLLLLADNGLYYDVTRHWQDVREVGTGFLKNTSCINLALKKSVLKNCTDD